MTLVVEFDIPAKCLTMNQRLHWAQKAKISRLWRDAACEGCRAMDWYVDPREYPATTPLEPCLVTVHLPEKGNRRRDPHNWFPTIKPIIDGLVDAGLWPDDTPEWVRCTEPVLEVNGDKVRVHMEPR
jgi:crossover junction endodeoxyribonuclease RusA